VVNAAAPGPNCTARRLRFKKESTTESAATRNVVMSVVVCAECGERFAISHDSLSQDAALAERQAAWLRDHFVWDHIQETRHRALIILPASADMK
jgi:hypothetical protein